MNNKNQQLLLIPEFQKFIAATVSGKRLMSSGKKMRKGTIEQYGLTLKLLQQYELKIPEPLRVTLFYKSSKRLFSSEKLYWQRFLRNFKKYLYSDRHCYDNYVSNIFKTFKCFFNYLNKEKYLPVGEFHKQFKIPNQHPTPVVLTPAQLKFLITDTAFHNSLPTFLQKIKDIIVFGCTVGLRYQDLMRITKNNLAYTNDGIHILLHTQKTNTAVQIPLPDYAVAIVEKYKKNAGKYVLPQLSNVNLNIHIKEIGKRAGWNHPLPKIRFLMGEPKEIKKEKPINSMSI